MEDSLLTKCPHCKTLFRIQHDHLAVADGEVRCGVCFKVFNAQAEGLAYGEHDTVTLSSTSEKKEQSKTSKEEAAQLVRNLELKEREKQAEKEIATQPDAATIDLLTIEEESVEQIFSSPHRKSMDRPWLWGTLSILSMLLLATQWLVLNHEQYSANPKWRPWYQAVCQTLGCELNLFTAPEQIKTERLAIKSHPDYLNVLVVDLIISNQAPFPQAMPTLDIAFYDINGATLSSRRFQPPEYLDQNISLHEMPTHTPIHLSFSIMDPGADAVNYGVHMVQAQ